MTDSSVRPVGVVSVGVGTPTLRIAVRDIASAWGGGGRGQLALCDSDEDTLTLAWQAATQALAAAGLDAAEVSGLWWGTSRPPMAEGPSHAFLATAVGLGPGASGALFCGSTHSGMEALSGAWDALAAGHAELALVVASDAVLPGVGTATETEAGAGATALLLCAPGAARESAARLVGRTGSSMPVVDRYRGDRQQGTAEVYDGRLFREEVFLPLLSEVGSDLATLVEGSSKNGSDSEGRKIACWSLSDPDGKLGSGVARRLGAKLASAELRSALGDTGAAAPLLGLVAATEALRSEDALPSAIGVLGYGGGRATAVAVEVSAPLPGADRLAHLLGGGKEVGYVEALKVRGQLPAMTEPIPMGVPPGSAAFVRGNVEMLRLQGARCAICSTVSVPPSIHPTCTGCGGTELSIVGLARTGKVQTFVVNQTMPAPFQAPLPLVVIDLDDGARLMLQGSPDDSEDLEIGTPVELKLRLYAVERGVPVYGYKAFATRSPGDAGAGATGSVGTEDRSR